MKEIYIKPKDRLPNAGIFLSGSGSNAEKLIQFLRNEPEQVMNISALVTDAPLTSRAHVLGETYGIPVLELDIKEFYHARGETRVSIASEAGQKIREEWTEALREKIAPYHFDFGVFAGFVPLTNITADFPCMNVHPGDLTFLKNRRRLFVGLHTIPIELAILEGLDYLRSSVIVVEPYSGSGDEMDSGLLLGISPKVPIDFLGENLETLAKCPALRPQKRPKGGYGDALETVAKANQDNLKAHGDWVVLPRVVKEFALGNYGVDDNGALAYKANKVLTVEFSEDKQPKPVI